MITFIDIETLPTDNEEIIQRLAKGIKPPATHKKQETIEKWMVENYASELVDLVNKTSFDGAYGRIACIAWAFDDGEVISTYADQSESDAIALFFDSIEKQGLKFCGQNIAAFDLPFLKHRSIINCIKPPKNIMQAMNAKPWDDCIADTKLIWNQDKNKHVSLDTLCAILGIEGKGDFDGSMVAETWPVDPQKVIDYCKHDVEITRAVYKRLTFDYQF